MVLAGLRRPAIPTFVIPDEQAWTVWNSDPVAASLEPVLDPGRVRRVLLPDSLPDQLSEAAVDWIAAMPVGVEQERRPVRVVPGDGAPHDEYAPMAPSAGHSPHDTGHAGHDGRGNGDHHDGGEHDDMMAITGEPSADGLVMEPIELSLGPLGAPLPGGLIVDAVLDGDVVAECTVRATLRHASLAADRPLHPPDLLAPVAWSATVAVAAEAHSGDAMSAEARWFRLATVELERAVSHLAWLRALGRLLGWGAAVDAVSSVLTPLSDARRRLPVELLAEDLPAVATDDIGTALDAASSGVQRILTQCEDSRRLASRTANRGAVSAEAALAMRLTGPVARATGVADDLRARDPLYRELGFSPVVRAEGDARARTLVRLEEALAAIALGRRAIDRAKRHAAAPDAPVSPAGAMTEGPRGALHAQRTAGNWRLSAPGEHGALAAASESAVGLEWGAALAVLASFDLSAWKVGP